MNESNISQLTYEMIMFILNSPDEYATGYSLSSWFHNRRGFGASCKVLWDDELLYDISRPHNIIGATLHGRWMAFNYQKIQSQLREEARRKYFE